MNKSENKFPVSPASMTEEKFIETFGDVYEHSPWIASETWRHGLTSLQDTVEGLSAAMIEILARASHEQLLTLVNAHPDLAGKAAMRGELTTESTSEQTLAGINECTPEEFERFQSMNDAYKKKFGIPFVMAVKDSNRQKILVAFEERLENDVDTEFKRSLSEINKITRLRLEAMADGE